MFSRQCDAMSKDFRKSHDIKHHKNPAPLHQKLTNTLLGKNEFKGCQVLFFSQKNLSRKALRLIFSGPQTLCEIRT